MHPRWLKGVSLSEIFGFLVEMRTRYFLMRAGERMGAHLRSQATPFTILQYLENPTSNDAWSSGSSM